MKYVAHRSLAQTFDISKVEWDTNEASLFDARILWGWPNKFLSRMKSVNTRVVIVNGNANSWKDMDD